MVSTLALSRTAAPDRRSLLAYSRQRTAATIAGYAGIGRALFEGERGAMTDRERSLMTSLLRRLVVDTETAIMRALDDAAAAGGDADAATDFVPRADTYERIAATGMLRDQALIEAAWHRMGDFQLEGAIRKHLGGRWSGADAADQAGTVSALAGSAGQFVRNRLNGCMVARAARIDAYENPVIPLTELDPDVLRRLCWNVAAALRLSIPEHREIDDATVDEALERGVLGALETLGAEDMGTSRAAMAADALADAGRLDAALVVEAMRRGEVQLSVAMFSRFAGLRRVLIYRLMFEPGGTGLAIACRAVKMTQTDFADLYLLTRNVHDAAVRRDGEGLDEVLSWFDGLPYGEAEKVIRYWRRPAEYLHALWRHRQRAGVGAHRD